MPNGAVFYSFTVPNGVRQGGVLTPILFDIYIDELLKRFEQLWVGCRIGQCFMGALGYADDITLLTPTKLALGQVSKEATSFLCTKIALYGKSSATSMNFITIADAVKTGKYKSQKSKETHTINRTGYLEIGESKGYPCLGQ